MAEQFHLREPCEERTRCLKDVKNCHRPHARDPADHLSPVLALNPH